MLVIESCLKKGLGQGGLYCLDLSSPNAACDLSTLHVLAKRGGVLHPDFSCEEKVTETKEKVVLKISTSITSGRPNSNSGHFFPEPSVSRFLRATSLDGTSIIR